MGTARCTALRAGRVAVGVRTGSRRRGLMGSRGESRAVERGQRAGRASDGDVQEGTWGGASFHAEQHG